MTYLRDFEPKDCNLKCRSSATSPWSFPKLGNIHGGQFQLCSLTLGWAIQGPGIQALEQHRPADSGGFLKGNLSRAGKKRTLDRNRKQCGGFVGIINAEFETAASAWSRLEPQIVDHPVAVFHASPERKLSASFGDGHTFGFFPRCMANPSRASRMMLWRLDHTSFTQSLRFICGK